MKEKDKEVEKAVEVGHDQVEEALLAKFDTMKSEEAEIQGYVWFVWNSKLSLQS